MVGYNLIDSKLDGLLSNSHSPQQSLFDVGRANFMKTHRKNNLFRVMKWYLKEKDSDERILSKLSFSKNMNEFHREENEITEGIEERRNFGSDVQEEGEETIPYWCGTPRRI